MKTTVRVLGFTISALVLAYSSIDAVAQSQPNPQAHSHGMGQVEGGTTGQGGMRQGGMMDQGMMGGGMMSRPTGSPMMFRMMFALMDDGDGQISMQEFQAAHERIFKAMDRNKDGQVTQEEMQAFMHGRTPASQQ
ncbi:EF-hand domain-containing protein [Bradyrhizobium sp. CCGE-LA001]|uniref:EF-hand domain-containing protein n=1 Tax=Bradyrhizobium sp. CCGE-LA001 TaxID=1223566 RepID=UPI0002AAA687|nr:EF-hand domain-containing protein [Bradyrhizobium sp. CCGE-LA001]AMA59623.1 hypothetical protein BCCGELA001_27415 [Bradyrhizobium sp. CCGE-LA001]